MYRYCSDLLRIDGEIEALVGLLVDEPIGGAGVPSTCARTRRPSSVTGSFSTYSSVRLSSAQATSGSTFSITSTSSSPLARSLKRSRNWRRPTDILRVREQAVVRAHFVAAELEERLTRRERVAVEQHDFGRLAAGPPDARSIGYCPPLTKRVAYQ